MRSIIGWCIAIIMLLSSCQSTIPPVTTPETTAPTFSSTEPQTEPTVESTVPETTQPPHTIDALLDSMSIEEKVGQLFLARCPSDTAIADIKTYHLGGYILFARDFENRTPEEVRRNIQSYQDAAAIPMLIAVDEEGGKVCRVSQYKQFRDTPFLSPRELYTQDGLQSIFNAEQEKCELLTSLGINVNAAPVCDITTNPNAFMYPRSLGEDAETTGNFVSGVINIMYQKHVGGILKHFPGYGNNTDTHTGIAVDTRTLEELERIDLVPFVYGIQSNCDAIMVSHTIVKCLDEVYPASLSLNVHNYLRNSMNFNGVIVTDDLVMQAITDMYGAGEAAILAVLAGNDLLCSTEYQVQYTAVLQAVYDGRISEQRITDAVRRVLQWKYNLGLIG